MIAVVSSSKSQTNLSASIDRFVKTSSSGAAPLVVLALSMASAPRSGEGAVDGGAAVVLVAGVVNVASGNGVGVEVGVGPSRTVEIVVGSDSEVAAACELLACPPSPPQAARSVINAGRAAKYTSLCVLWMNDKMTILDQGNRVLTKEHL